MTREKRSFITRNLASTALAATLAWATAAGAEDWVPSDPNTKLDPDATTLITNVSIFNGTDSDSLTIRLSSSPSFDRALARLREWS